MMAGYPGRLLAFSLALIPLVTTSTYGSERSELLTTRAQIAYRAGRFEEARRDFADAVADDPRDAAAQYGLGLALARLGRWQEAGRAFEQALDTKPDFTAAREALALVSLRLGQAALDKGDQAQAGRLLDRATELSPRLAGRARSLIGWARTGGERPSSVAASGERWGLYGAAGTGYDSNVKLDPDGAGSAAFTLGLGGHYDPFRRSDALLRLQYDFYQSLYTDAGSFDFRANEIGTTAAYLVRPSLWANLQALYAHYAVGSAAFLEEPIITPYLTLLEPWGETQGLFRFEYRTYLDPPFQDIRNGPDYTTGVNQFIFLDPERFLTVGFEFENEQPRSSAGNDYRQRSYQGNIGAYFPAWWQTSVALSYVFRYDDYPEPNSFANFTTNRVDHEHLFFAEVSRMLTDNVRLAVAYHGTINNSNIALFEYRRSVVLASIQVVY